MQYPQYSPLSENGNYIPPSNLNLQMYLNEIGQYKVSSNEESMILAMRFKKYDDHEAAQQLILTNLRLVVKIALKYQAYWKSNLLDLIQEGNSGLVIAIEKFDPYRKVTFYTYATYWVRSYILRFLMNNSRLVKITTTSTMRRMYFNYNRKKKQLEMQTGKADDNTLAKILQINKDKLAEVNERFCSSEISLATPVSNDSDGCLQDTIKHPGPSVADEVELRELRSMVQQMLEKEKNRLSSREHFILHERLLTDSPISLKDIGGHMNISGERARQLEVNLLEKLRKAFCREFTSDSSCVL